MKNNKFKRIFLIILTLCMAFCMVFACIPTASADVGYVDRTGSFLTGNTFIIMSPVQSTLVSTEWGDDLPFITLRNFGVSFWFNASSSTNLTDGNLVLNNTGSIPVTGSDLVMLQGSFSFDNVPKIFRFTSLFGSSSTNSSITLNNYYFRFTTNSEGVYRSAFVYLNTIETQSGGSSVIYSCPFYLETNMYNGTDFSLDLNFIECLCYGHSPVTSVPETHPDYNPYYESVVRYTNRNGGFIELHFPFNRTALYSASTNQYYLAQAVIPYTHYYFSDFTNEQFEAGYNEGERYGYNKAKDEYYTKGYDTGYSVGKSAGFSEGVANANEYSFLGLFSAVFDAPIKALGGLLNFDILGFNMLSFALSLFTLSIVIFFISKVMK